MGSGIHRCDARHSSSSSHTEDEESQLSGKSAGTIPQSAQTHTKKTTRPPSGLDDTRAAAKTLFSERNFSFHLSTSASPAWKALFYFTKAKLVNCFFFFFFFFAFFLLYLVGFSLFSQSMMRRIP
jgi:hypothetical protein